MTFNHEAVAALPVGGPADAALIRAMCERRFAYVLASTETPGNFVAVDPASGVVVQMLFQNNIGFLYDPTDSTTVNDGVTCLVSSDGKRFKSATVTPPYSALSTTTVAEPVSPAVGDVYLIPTAATGADWAGKDGTIGIFTSRGWVFAASSIGRFLFIRDQGAFYFKNASGVWTAGVGNIALAPDSVPMSAVIGSNASFKIKVENQTTDTPPVSPSVGVVYIIGSSPTGSWAGQAGKLAVCNVAGSFAIEVPVAGDEVYDKALASDTAFNGTAWVTPTPITRSTSTTYNVTAADNGTTISLHGGAFQTILFPSGVLANGFKCKIFNEETTPVGKGVGGVTNLGSFTLYPTQAYNIEVVNSVVMSIGGLQPY
jgi:hypothetical protein